MEVQIESLVIAIKQANKAYREGNPYMSDFDYDKLIDTLRSVDPLNPLLYSVGIKSKESKKSHLPLPMGSLDKVKSIQEVKDWLSIYPKLEEIVLVITPKLDGISICVDHSNNKAWTRGDGVVGEDCSDKFLDLDCKHDLRVYPRYSYGEAIIKKQAFKEVRSVILKDDGTQYSTARNMVAGLFNKDENSKGLKNIEYISYGIGDNYTVNKHIFLNTLNCNAFESIPYKLINALDLSEELFEHLYNIWSSLYEIDGLVIDIDDSVKRRYMGRKSNGTPNYAMAIKLPQWNPAIDIEIIEIQWQPSKDSYLVPVGKFKPIDIEGKIYDSITFYNASWMIRSGVKAGSYVRMELSGGIIPTSIDIYNPFNADEVINSFPSQFEGVATYLEEVHLCLKSKSFSVRIMEDAHFFKILGVELGVPTITAMYRSGFYMSTNALVEILNTNKNELMSVVGIQDSTANYLFEEFAKIKILPIWKLASAHNMFSGMGEKTFKAIDKEIDLYSLDPTYLEQDRYFNEMIKKLDAIENIGRETAIDILSTWTDFCQFLRDINYQRPIISWEEKMQSKNLIDNKEEGPIYRKTFCFTGFRSNQIQELIEEKGGEIKSSVSKSLNYLVRLDETFKMGKVIEAEKMGIKIITKQQLEEWLN